jgi:hypothetical protein
MYSLHSVLAQTEKAAVVVTFYTCIQEELGSNLIQGTGYP